MKQEGYLDEKGQPIVKEPIDPKKLIRNISIVVLVVLIVVFIAIFLYNKSRNDKCTSIESRFMEAALKIAEDDEKLPALNGNEVTISSDEIKEKGNINRDDITLNENVCNGTVTITKVKGDYVTVATLTNCDYCTTDERYGDFGDWTDTEPKEGDYVEVKTTYNYYTYEDYYTEYSKWIKEEDVETKKDKEYDIYMPINEDIIPDVPEPGELIAIEQDTKNTYSYRDKRWKYYANLNDNYSAYSNEPVAGYAYKDEDSKIESEPSDWSPNYPDEKDYRVIHRETGYRWYKEVDGEKEYWENGRYYPTSPGDDYIQDEEKEITLYSYVDDLYRYYNGVERDYSTYRSEPLESRPYRDDETMIYTNWSMYRDESKIDSSNSYYREERINVNSRYRVKYRINSVLYLQKYLEKEDFEKEIGMTVEELNNTPNTVIRREYQYRYRKVK